MGYHYFTSLDSYTFVYHELDIHTGISKYESKKYPKTKYIFDDSDGSQQSVFSTSWYLFLMIYLEYPNNVGIYFIWP